MIAASIGFSASLTFATGLLAQDVSLPLSEFEVSGTFEIIEENDVFKPFGRQTDRWYSQGLHLQSIHSSARSSDYFVGKIPLDFWCTWLCADAHTKGVANSGWGAGQSIYTPSNINIRTPQPDDHPWAGYLYASRVAQKTYHDPLFHTLRRDRLTVSLGLTGPGALAKDAQKLWHKIFSFQQPQGWSNQLKTEPTVLLTYKTALQYINKERWLAIEPHVQLSLGNVLVAAQAGATARLGWNLRPFAQPTGSSRQKGWFPFGSIFARSQWRMVAHNIFLDGNTFRDGPNLNKRAVVHDIAAGVELGIWGPWSISADMTRRSPEFRSALPRADEHQTIGTIRLSRILY